ncbi:DNA polymerase III subunit alpha [Rossellomorea marisflavi]|uniref:DNA-directed DNA polymerase n=1 Tax=Rossellomorea marisflavi TaxID=189381 RepID=A0A5D4S3L1_9BACI|nr:PHP domain-containing protein [Rossellomorea marisflavi]TYS56346.1 DNA polymerase III subunit alpha [Rossellomorea marisflavi]
MCLISCHNHTARGSNLRLLDCTNDVKELIHTAAKIGYKGLAITDHESISAHIEAIKKARDLKKRGDIPQDFKLILGNEIYLIDSLEETRDNYKSGVTKFPHFLLISKDKKGHEQLRYLSSKAWENSFHTGFMERTPTDKETLKEVVKNDPNHLIATTACLGSESSIHLLALREAELENNQELINYHKSKLMEFIKWNIDVFGKENFFIELQPALSEEQIYVNQKLIPIADYFGLKRIISTDTHYLRPEDRVVHKAFLNSKDGEREVDDFYEACFLQTEEEIYERMHYLEKEVIDDAIQNTLLIGEMVEDYTIEHDPVIPKIDLPEFEIRHLFKPAYDKYAYINKMVNSDNEQDRYMVKLLEDGFEEYIPFNTLSKEKFHQILARINMELEELWEISVNLNQAMTSYYITVQEIINIIWSDDECGGNSLVGSGRGSAAGFLINYLLGITQVNPLEYGIELPHWRHLHRSRPDIPDIDVDSEGSKRPQIIKALINHFGSNRVLQVCTFGTEKSKSALQTACRGLEIDSDIALYLSGMIPFERGENWTLSDCYFGNEEQGRKPIKELIREVEKYPNLKETSLKIEGLVNKRSIHASGIIIFNEDYYKSNAMMKAPNGDPITQFNLGDCEAVGNVKFDLLTIEALDKIRATLDMLIEYDEIKWIKNLRQTFNHYLHPDNIEKTKKEIYEMLGSGEILDLFQFSTEIGMETTKKVKPNNLLETAAANSLMRLMSDGEEQPIDIFIKHKNDISIWYEEMNSYGLNSNEIKVMEEHLLKLSGVADTQECVMQISMDERVAGFDVQLANKLRKAIAKRSKDALEEVESKFFKMGKENGNRDEILNYVWNVQIKRQLGYSFSILHTIAYSLVALQELNLNYKYNPLYWQTACLSVNAGSNELDTIEEDHKNKSTNYGKIAYAIGNIRQRGIKVDLPDINKAKFSFTPDLQNNSIVFGLKGMNGIGDEVVHTIISNRPYASFDHFIEKMYVTGLVKKSQITQLIKGGCFDSFGDRKETMKKFAKYLFEPKKQLNMQNMNMLVNEGLIPDEFHLCERLFKYKAYISKSVYKVIKSPKDRLFKLDDVASPFFNQYFTESSVEDVSDQGELIISEKKFKKEYDALMERLREWMSNDETLQHVNEQLLERESKVILDGSVSKWEMDSLSFYYHDHELAHMNKEKYDVSIFSDLPEDPEVVETYVSRGIERKVFKLSRIAGTVLDRDKNKHKVTLLTTDGVVTVKFYGGSFSHYNKQLSRPTSSGKKEVVEPSWFTRGNKLLITGFRRGNQFSPRTYKNSIYRHTVALIEDIDDQGNLTLKTEREEI